MDAAAVIGGGRTLRVGGSRRHIPAAIAVLLAGLLTVASSAKIPWWHIKIAQEQGPNACVVEEVPGTNHRLYTECKYWTPRKICGQKTVIRYECCEGYYQIPGQKGCTGVKPLKSVLETARDLGAGEFVRRLERAGLAEDLSKDGGGSFTLFAPVDGAFQNAPRWLQSRLEERRSPLLLYHSAARRVPSSQFSHHPNHLLLPSRHTPHRLHLYKHQNGMETVNCALILRKDQEASNGIVHLIDAILDPETSIERDMGRYVTQDGRFSILARAMEESGVVERLNMESDSEAATAPVTVFAPSDEAFQSIPQARLKKIMSDPEARLALVENHILAHPVCPSTITGEQKLRTISVKGGKLKMECHTPRRGGHWGEISMRIIEGQKLPKEFSLSQNGPLYMVGKVVLPDRAKTLMQLIEREDLKEFLKTIRYAGLDDTLENFGDFTIFAPSNEAMKAIPKSALEEMKTNQAKARKFVLYHGTPGRLKTDQVAHQQVVMSLDEENPLRLQVLRKAVGVENALINKGNMEGLNGVLHVISRPLFPANRSAGDLLRNNGNFSIFLEAVGRVMETAPNALELAPSTTASPPTTTTPSKTTVRHHRPRPAHASTTPFPPPPLHLPTFPSQQHRGGAAMREWDSSVGHHRQGSHHSAHHTGGRHTNYSSFGAYHPTASYFTNSTTFSHHGGTASWWSSWYSYSSSSSSSSSSSMSSSSTYGSNSSSSSSTSSSSSFAASSSGGAAASFLHSSADSPASPSNPSSITMFVPTNEAFHRLGQERLNKMMEDIPYLTKTIKNHVSQSMMCSDSFRPGLHYNVRTGQDALDVIRKGKKIKVNGATVVNSDLINSNGVIHVIDRVLLP
ncbi:transforming growth factor-beta-induced protein ig-h3-like [Hetaerina americana]|uniref:transforming growth factor-beta-induced protein ig-h3-like n=1 Tax=Hetaerina americana TaxID=62018 RepID=UPI003A7F2EA5